MFISQSWSHGRCGRVVGVSELGTVAGGRGGVGIAGIVAAGCVVEISSLNGRDVAVPDGTVVGLRTSIGFPKYAGFANALRLSCRWRANSLRPLSAAGSSMIFW